MNTTPAPILTPTVGTYRLPTATGGVQVVSTRSPIGDAAKSAWDAAVAAIVPGGSIISPAAQAVGRAADEVGGAVTDLAKAATSGTRSAFFWGGLILVVLIGLWALSTARNIAKGA